MNSLYETENFQVTELNGVFYVETMPDENGEIFTPGDDGFSTLNEAIAGCNEAESMI